jgi:hypothetical protein
LYGFDEMEYGDDMEEAELDEEIDDYLFEENDYIID